jgi:hypothetical protein
MARTAREDTTPPWLPDLPKPDAAKSGDTFDEFQE